MSRLFCNYWNYFLIVIWQNTIYNRGQCIQHQQNQNGGTEVKKGYQSFFRVLCTLCAVFMLTVETVRATEAESSIESSEEITSAAEEEETETSVADNVEDTESSSSETEETTKDESDFETEESEESIPEIELLEETDNTGEVRDISIPTIRYQTHVQTYDWQDWVQNGDIGGTVGYAKRMEAFKIQLQDTELSGGIEYRSHVQTYGWMDWVSNGEMSGSTGQAKRLEAIQIRLTGELAEYFDVYYRVHSQTYGWLDWACNGDAAGTVGLAKRAEALQIVLMKKGSNAPGDTENPYVEELEVRYTSHMQTYGWMAESVNGETNGAAGKGKRMEAVQIKLANHSLISGSIEYRTHCQTYGWMDWVSEGKTAGTTGLAKRLEAIQIRLTGEMAERYDIYYRVNSKDYGWLDWAKNGEAAGTAGLTKTAEAIQIVLVKKDGAAPGSTEQPYIENLEIRYAAYMQTHGWLSDSVNGGTSGITDQAKRLEAVRISLANHSLIPGSVEYRVYSQGYGWMDWASEGETAGTTDQAKRLEAIEIRLTGEISEKYDIYYRVLCQNFGWTGWASNGMPAGSDSCGEPTRAIEIKLVEKGGAAPGSTENTFFEVPFWGIDVSSWQGSVNWAKAKADGVDFAMLRITQLNTDGTDQRLMKDRHLDDNVRGALANGIPVGGYVYIYSSTPEEAREDAEYALSLIEDYNFSYPIAFDLEEEEHMTTAAKLNNMAMAKAFCEVFEEAGYTTCVYGSPSKLRDVFDYDEIADSYDIWLARYRWSEEVMDFNDESVRDLVYDTGYEGGNWTGLSNVQMWQFTSTGRVDGVAGNVDLDLCYKVY